MIARASRTGYTLDGLRAGPTDHFRSFVAHRLISRGQWPNSQRLQEWICDENDFHELHVQRHGHCGLACDFAGLEQTAIGNTVCRWTRLPCPHVQLSRIVALFSIPNRRDP